jgi:LPS sulfotransferase NodH
MSRVRFLVTGVQRSGTSLLVWLLDSHPQIRCYGGVFNRGSPGTLDPHAESSIPMIERLYTSEERLDDPAHRYECEPGGPRAVGFKVHPNQWAASVCLGHVVEATEIKVLHMRRRNVLRLLVSDVNARRTGTWNSIYAEDATRAPVAVSREQLEQMDAYCERVSQEIARDFAAHEIREVWYEDLARARSDAMAPVQSFLGVDAVADLHTDTIQLGVARLEDAVENYDELAREVAGTPLQRYFR